MSILQNAVESIAVGLEDFSSTDPRRASSCARNVFAGVLLLFKHKLVLLSPCDSDEVLIKARVLPTQNSQGQVEWRGKGRKTVDVQNIKERFSSLGIDVDWARLERVNEFRNDIEHYYSNLTHESVRSLISDSFLIINDFIRKHLEMEPKELLGDEAWGVLIDVSEVYEREKSECASALEKLTYWSPEILKALQEHMCGSCGSGLIYPISEVGDALEADLACKSCDSRWAYEDVVCEAVSEHFFADMYLSMTDGGDPPIVDCPECDGLYIFSEGVCCKCGYSAVHQCQICESPIIPDELCFTPYCGWCAHKLSRMDD